MAMQRREILYGSGVLFATVLTGCIGAGDPDDDGGETEGDSDENGDDDYDDGDSEDSASGTDELDDVPGLDGDAIDLGEDATLRYVELDDDELSVGIESEIADESEFESRVGDGSARVADAIVDRDAFESAVTVVGLTVYDEDGGILGSGRVEVVWILEWLDGDLTDEEFAEKIEVEAD